MVIRSIVGLFAFALIAWVISENRRKVDLRVVATGLILQVLTGFILLKLPLSRELFIYINKLFLFLEESTNAGTSFVFGYLGGGSLPFDEKFPGSSFILAFRALPLVLVMSALSSLLFYWKILPLVVRAFSWGLQKTMKIGGAEGLGVSAEIFLGMVESPLLIRPYLKDMTRSELFSQMTCGMATIAGTVMLLYAGILSRTIPDIMGHLLVASIVSVPAAITVAKIMVPETGKPTTGEFVAAEKSSSSMDAVTKGTIQGVELVINIVAMLVVLVALVHFVNLLLGLFPDLGNTPISLQRILGFVMSPLVWLMGIPWKEAHTAGILMGTKTILNELIAYIDMSKLPEGSLSPRSLMIMTYAMCGFANLGSLGIMIGGIGTMAPERREEVVSLGFRTIISGTLATCMTGTVAGLVLM